MQNRRTAERYRVLIIETNHGERFAVVFLPLQTGETDREQALRREVKSGCRLRYRVRELETYAGVNQRRILPDSPGIQRRSEAQQSNPDDSAAYAGEVPAILRRSETNRVSIFQKSRIS